MNAATKPSAGLATISCGGAELAELAVDDDPDQVGERRRVLVVVGHEQRGQPELAEELLELATHRDLRVRVERRERLVEQQDARVARERPGERDALPLAARQLARPRLRKMRDPEPLEVLVDALAARRRHVLAHGHVREERVLLEDEPDAPLVGLAEDPAPTRRTRRRHRARCARLAGVTQTGDRAEHRGLAGAGRAHERERPRHLRSTESTNVRRGNVNEVARDATDQRRLVGGARGEHRAEPAGALAVKSFTVIRMATLKITRSALIASEMSRPFGSSKA